MLWSAGLQQLRRLPFAWFALHCCLLLIRSNLCSKHNDEDDGVGETEDCAAILLFFPALITSSICFKSCFFTTIFTLIIPPSCSSVFETTLPLLIFATDSKKLLLVVFWFRPVLDILCSLFGEPLPSATFKYSMISLFLSLSVYIYLYVFFLSPLVNGMSWIRAHVACICFYSNNKHLLILKLRKFG